jgi:predicted 2-oxoglutarate/Fe(II)-dependent dioxygenase YbiX
MRGLYRVVKNLLDPSEALEIAEIIKNSQMDNGDSQVPKSRSCYCLPVCNILLGRMTEKVSELAGKRLRPSYTYCRVYLKGADLKPHKDRPSCEYSVTLNLSQTHPWTIYMGKRGVVQKPGDAVLYKGCEIEHSRKEFTGDEYVQVFLHYVDADGPHKDHVYDIKKEEPTYRYIFNLDPFPNHVDYYKYVKCIPEEIIDALRTKLDTKELKDAEVGGGGQGVVDKVKRRSKVFWLPKTDEFHEIYRTLFELVGNCNRDFYQFNIHELVENIQYTVYNEDDQGHYDWHVDMGPGKARRKLSLVVQLSDPSEYEGGELQINTGKIMIPEKEKGTVILFPSYLLHRVTPVTKGTRRSLVVWINGPAFV